jgi:hypothetical protein
MFYTVKTEVYLLYEVKSNETKYKTKKISNN